MWPKAPKSNSACMSIDNALAQVRAGNIGPVPNHLKRQSLCRRKEAGPWRGLSISPQRAQRLAAPAIFARQFKGRGIFMRKIRGIIKAFGRRQNHEPEQTDRNLRDERRRGQLCIGYICCSRPVMKSMASTC